MKGRSYRGRRWFAVAGVLMLLAIGAVISTNLRPGDQARYGGKPILAHFPTWIADKGSLLQGGTITFAGPNPPPIAVQRQIRILNLRSRRSAELLADLDAEAVPWLLLVIRREDGLFKRMYQQQEHRLPKRIHDLLPMPIPAEMNRQQAEMALSLILARDPDRTIPIVLESLRSGTQRERIIMARCLSSSSQPLPPSAISALAGNLRHSDNPVRLSALQTLVGQAGRDDPAIAALAKFWGERRNALIPEEARLAEEFCRLLRQVNSSRRRPALAALLNLRTNENALVRVEAIYTAWTIDREIRGEHDLFAILKSEASGVPWDRALGYLATAPAPLRLSPDEVVPLMKRVLADGNRSTRADAASVLAHFKEHALVALPELRSALRDPDRRLRSAAARAIEAIGPAGLDAIPSWIEALDDPAIQTTAARALGIFGAKASAAAVKLTELLLDSSRVSGSTELRAAAAETLGLLGVTDEPVLRALQSGAADSETEVRDASIRAWRRLHQAAGH